MGRTQNTLTMSDVNEQLNEMLRGMSELQTEMDQLRRQNASMRNLLDQSEPTNRGLFGRFRRATETPKNMAESDETVVELENQLKRVTKQRDCVISERDGARHDLTAARATIEDMTRQIDQERETLTGSVNEQLADKDARIEELNVEVNQARAASAVAVGDKQSKIDELKAINDMLHSRDKIHKDDIKGLNESIRMAEQKLMAFELNQLGYNFNTRNLDKLKFHIWGGAGLVWTANDRLTSVSFDSRVYRSGHASAVRLTKNGHAAYELKVNGTYIRSFTLRTDSKLVTGAADGTVTLWHHDKKTNELRGSVRFTTKSKVITAMARAHNNRILACYSGTSGNRPGTSRKANIELLGPQLNVEKTFQGSRRETTSIAFNEHQLIGTGGADMVVRIYNMSGRGEPVKRFLEHTAKITSVAWRETQLASSSFDGTVRLWEAGGIKSMRVFSHNGPVNALKWSPIECKLASCGDDKKCQLWDIESGARVWSMRHTARCTQLDWTPCGALLACSDELGLRLWSTRSGIMIKEYALGHTRDLKFSPNGRTLAIGMHDGHTSLIDLRK